MFIRETHKRNSKNEKKIKQYYLLSNYRVGKKTKKKDNKMATVSTYTQLTNEAITIYRALNMSSMPLTRTKFVVPHARPPAAIIAGI